MSRKLPFLQFYVDDWLADEKLRTCSLAARGLWIDMLSLMHKCGRRGFLQQANGKPFSKEHLGRICGCSAEEAGDLLQELIATGVALVDERGVVFSKRMVQDEHIRQVRSKAGSKGGNPVLLKQNSSKGLTNPLSTPMEYDSESEEERGGAGGKGKPHVRDPPPPQHELTPAGLAQEWCFRCTRKFRGMPADSERDIESAFAEMVRAGYAPAELLAEIRSEDRYRNETFLAFSKRFQSEHPPRRSRSAGNGVVTTIKRPEDDLPAEEISQNLERTANALRGRGKRRAGGDEQA